MRRTVFTATSLVAAIGCVTSRTNNVPTTGIPGFPQDSVTRDSTGRKLGALAGVVLDSASGSGIEGAQVLLRSPDGTNRGAAYTNKRGGFVIGKIEPGSYNVLARRLGYLPSIGRRDLRAGVVDTVILRIAASNATLSSISTAARQLRAPHYLTVVAADERFKVVGFLAFQASRLQR
jgi:hypothetical protein